MSEYKGVRRMPSRQTPLRPRVKRALLALALAVGAVFAWQQFATAADTDPTATNCVGAAPSAGPDGQATWVMHCTAPMPSVTIQVPGPTVTVPGPTFTETTTITVTAPPSVSTTTVTVTPSPSKSPSNTPPATTPPPSPSPSNGGWPDANNTGVPAGVVLTTYTGPCTITTANTVIDSKTVNCTLSIRASGVVIRNSKINGGIENGEGARPTRSFTVTDSDIIAGVDNTGIAESYFTALRVDISGGNRGANCFTNCTVQDSYIHGNRVSCTVAVCGDSAPHASGLRAGMNTTYVHNYLQCTVGGNCSADLTGYPDFSITTNWDIRGNFFGAVTAAQWCAYDGAVGGKPYSNDPNNATNIRFVDNVFARGGSRKCGQASPVAFDGGRSRPGWVFTGNRFDDGVAIP